METTIKKIPKSQIELKIELSAEEFNDFIKQAIDSLGKDLEIKGFRKGMAPKEVVEKELGLEKVLIEAADLAVKESYKKAILENKIEAILQPEIEIKKLAKGDSFIFLAKTFVLPEIKLPDYKKIASQAKRKKIEISDEEIKNSLKWLQQSRAKFSLRNRPAQKGDFVEIEYRSSQLGGQEYKDAFILGQGHFLPGFEEALIGMSAGETKEEILVNPPKNHPLFGKKINIKVKMKSVQKIELPEINDDFAKNLGKFKGLLDLKKNIKEGLFLEKEKAESLRLRNEILTKINEKTDFEIPEILIEREQKQMLEEIKKNVSENLKISFAEYLKKIKKTEKELLESLFSEAKKRVKSFLILREIGKKEQIEASEEEIEEEANKLLRKYSSVEAAKDLDPEKLKEYTKEVIITEKIFQLLESLTANN